MAPSDTEKHDGIPNGVAHNASLATDAEHSMSLWQGIKKYPKAVGWSVLLSTALVMEGYDVTLLGNLFSQPAFQKRFGEPDGKGGYQVTAAWQSGLSNTFGVGSIIGLMIAGTCAERFGYRKTMMSALTMIIGAIFVVFFAKNLVMLLFGEILCSCCWGIFQTITVTYASEVCPLCLRAYLTTYVNLCWVLGQFVGAGVLRGVVDRMDQWAYKIPFAIQWVWPVPLITGILFAPESPWWLVRKGRNADARKALLRLTSIPEESATNETLSLIVYTTELEKTAQEGTSYWDCFRGFDLRRTEIVCCVYAIQITCGCPIMGYSVYFMEQAGFSPANAFSMSIGQSGIGAIGTIGSWFLMPHIGRRTLYLWGAILMALILLVIGFIGIAPKTNTSAQWSIGALLLVLTFVYDITIGPVCYSLTPELSSTRLRNKSVVLARVAYNLVGIVANVLQPHMLNPTAWNWGAKSAFFWVGTCVLSVLWIFWRLPEPKGRTYAELDVLFRNRTPARKFKTAEVDAFVYAEEIESKLAKGEKDSTAVHVEEL